MITLAFSVLVFYFFSQVTGLSGFGGVNSVDLPGVVGSPESDPLPRYFVTLVVAVLVFLWLGALSRTAFGLGLQGVRDEPARMRALGFDVTLHRTLAFGIAAFVAGIAGVLSVFYNGRITPGSINLGADDRRPDRRRDRRPLPARGSVDRRAHLRADRQLLARWVPEVGNVLGPARFNTLIGVLFLIIVLASPGGIIGIWDRVAAKLRRPRRNGSAGPAPAPHAGAIARSTSSHRGEKGSATTYTRRDGRCPARPSRSPAAAATTSGGSDNASGGASQQAAGGGTIKIGFLSDCEGAFGSFFEPTASGANLALIKYAGAKPAGDKPTDGVTGAKIAGKDVEIVSYGCADDTADKAIEETRRMMEQEDADILVGPLSGDEGIAVANYAKEHPDKTFVNGIAGAQDSTLKVQAPNFFRFHPDGAQWSAGLGDYAYNKLGWKKAAIIGDDYSFPYTSLAGFVAEFCAVGGQIPKRVWAPLGEEDYSSYISQIPKDVDGLYVGIGGSGLISFIKQYEEQRGRVDTERMLGNVFWDDPLVLKEVGKSLVGGVTAAMTAADSDAPEVATYIQGLKDAYGDEIAGAGPSVFTYGYYTGDDRADQGARRGRRRRRRPEQAAGRAGQDDAQRRRGPVGRRQARRQPPGDLERLPEEDRRRHHGRRRAGRARRSRACPRSTRPSTASSPRTRPRPTARTRSARPARRRRGSASPKTVSFAK